ncbi:hypothetical protein AWB76_07517 [Caballeronia temeraria]|uniref:Uncharacterized protein n=1 Tax=Caballeronia temeraria TaxID=1777137 RepID=A0A158DXA7_9BURK|nr:hypothetical protein [Caballeronia temeraria]SAK98357.1 hypothetical protein AWB76_07517 [Caballeronia temeraria]
MNPIFEEKTRDGEIARALNMALHAFCVHSGAQIIMEGESVTLNFSRETAAITRALQLLGVRAGETLPAPNFDQSDLGKKKVPGF